MHIFAIPFDVLLSGLIWCWRVWEEEARAEEDNFSCIPSSIGISGGGVKEDPVLGHSSDVPGINS